MGLRDKALAAIAFMIVFVLLNVPFSLSLHHSATPQFFLAGFAVIDLPLILMAIWLSLESWEIWRWAALLIGPTLLGISLGLSAVIYEIVVKSNYHWSLIFSCVMLSTIAIFSTQIVNIYVVEGSDVIEDDYPVCKTIIHVIATLALLFYFNAVPSFNFVRTIFQPHFSGCFKILISYGLILIFQFLYASSARILQKLKRNEEVSVRTHLLFNSICLGHLFVYCPIALYIIVTLIQSICSLASAQRLSASSLTLFLFNAILLALTIPCQAIFTIYNGILYLDFLYLRYFTGMAASNPSFFAVGTFDTEEILISIKIEDYRTGVYSNLQKYLKKTQFNEFMSQSDCWICLENFRNEETILAINSCRHIFHETCIEKWIEIRKICPVCRLDIAESSINNTSTDL